MFIAVVVMIVKKNPKKTNAKNVKVPSGARLCLSVHVLDYGCVFVNAVTLMVFMRNVIYGIYDDDDDDGQVTL